MQHDYCFHHRVDRVINTISCGKGYADAFAEWAAYVAETAFAFPDDKLEHLIDYYMVGLYRTLIYAKIARSGV